MPRASRPSAARESRAIKSHAQTDQADRSLQEKTRPVTDVTGGWAGPRAIAGWTKYGGVCLLASWRGDPASIGAWFPRQRPVFDSFGGLIDPQTGPESQSCGQPQEQLVYIFPSLGLFPRDPCRKSSKCCYFEICDPSQAVGSLW